MSYRPPGAPDRFDEAMRPDLAALGAELQVELRLVDWQVTYVYVPDLADANGNPVYGLCDRLVDNKTATIAIRDPLASAPLPEGAEEKPVEAILMHELVHLHVAPLAVNTPQGITAEEQAVWPIAEALTRWRGTARGEMVARAMSLGARKQRVGPRSTGGRAMNRTELGMLKSAMEGKEPEAALAAAKAALAAYEKAMPPEEEKPKEEPKPEAAAAARAAEAPLDKDGDRDAKAARAAEGPPKAAMTIHEIEGVASRAAARTFAEHSERAALIGGNAERLGPKLAAELSALPLATVKSIVAARLLDAPAGPEQRAARAGVGPLGPIAGRDGLDGVPASDRDDTAMALRRMAKIMGVTTETPKAIEITSRGMFLSHVGSLPDQVRAFVQQQQAAAGQGAR